MNTLRIWSYNLMQGCWEVFPYHLLGMIDGVGKLGFTWQDARGRPELWLLLNEYWYLFNRERVEDKNAEVINWIFWLEE